MITRSIIDDEIDFDSLATAGIYFFSIYLVFLLLWYAATLGMNRVRFLNLFLGPGLAVFYLHQFVDRDDWSSFSQATDDRFSALLARMRPLRKIAVYAYPLIAVLSLAFSVYVEYHFDRIRVDVPLAGMTSADLYVGILIMLIILHATKVAFGWIISLFTVLTVLYGFAGPWMPGIFSHSGMDVNQIVFNNTMALNGVYGFIPRVGATWVAIFIVFAGMAKSLGLLDYVMSVGTEIGSKVTTGITHVAVVSSFIIGSMTGAAAANTATTGTFTIPLMKDQGLKDEYAAAIESVASSGSQVLPPVMGIAAFLMAEIIGISYFEVIRGAALPALLFFISIAIIIHLLILKNNWTIDTSDEPIDYSVFSTGYYFIVPLGVLLFTLVVLRMTPLGAGLYTILSLIAINFLWTVYQENITVDTFKELGASYLEGVKEGALEMVPLLGVLGALGIVVQMVTQTGLSGKISAQMLGLAGGVFVLLLLLAMLTSLLFGLGMPTPAAYILVVFLVAPALLEFGVQQLTGHLFVFYFAMLSAITPPVALCCAIGSRIANCSFIGTCKQALRIGAPAFVLPFAFVANDSLIFWSFPSTVLVFLGVLFGFVILGMGLSGHNGARSIGIPLRGLYLGLGLAILVGPPTVMVAAGGVSLLFLIGDVFGLAKVRSTLSNQ
ncbi:TRAP transporter fused permease subunit [Natronomonas sp. CBA1123]|jgi:TRAP transporter 4TM/12TM fusion protein|uniref:TRAP transporter permease n=1 Tax=Natronomonas sp. CBA1123 TaxID=2668070 RepID=UPI0012EA6916|nr:TRAP transporter fused permease subunit [Natronomonas sp. CBA1123]MUV85547.1 TRAP transporter fused permease subunit [Natronomonas sp. CBA1123]